MPLLRTSTVHVLCVGLALALVLAGWILNLRSLFAQSFKDRESGTWNQLFSSKAQTIGKELRTGKEEMKEAVAPVLEAVAEGVRRQQAYEAAIHEMKETISPYVETGTQETRAL